MNTLTFDQLPTFDEPPLDAKVYRVNTALRFVMKNGKRVLQERCVYVAPYELNKDGLCLVWQDVEFVDIEQ
jgi:hypothetical protein